MRNRQCYKSIIQRLNTQHGRDTSVVITIEPCVSERMSQYHYHGQQFFIDHEISD